MKKIGRRIPGRTKLKEESEQVKLESEQKDAEIRRLKQLLQQLLQQQK